MAQNLHADLLTPLSSCCHTSSTKVTKGPLMYSTTGAFYRFPIGVPVAPATVLALSRNQITLQGVRYATRGHVLGDDPAIHYPFAEWIKLCANDQRIYCR